MFRMCPECETECEVYNNDNEYEITTYMFHCDKCNCQFDITIKEVESEPKITKHGTAFKPISNKLIIYKPLAKKVLTVAVEGSINDWAAYIDSVPGDDHSCEWEEVYKHGSKLPETIAKLLYPEFQTKTYRS